MAAVLGIINFVLKSIYWAMDSRDESEFPAKDLGGLFHVDSSLE